MMKITIGCFFLHIFAFWIVPTTSLVPAPVAIQPLQYIQAPIIFEYIKENFNEIVWDAVLPSSLNDALAIGISEGASGFIGGVAVKFASLIDGNKQDKDSTLTNGGASGIFFATRGALRALAEILGGSTILVNVGSLILATIISEVVKLRGRTISQQQTRVGDGPTMLELMRFRDPKMQTLMNFRETEKKFKDVKRFPTRKLPPKPMPRASKMPVISELPINTKIPVLSKREIASDVVKWLVYDISVPNVAYVPIDVTANLGALAGITSQLIKETGKKKRLSLPIVEEDIPLARVSRAAFEGAVQFVTYEFTRQWLLTVAPDPDRFLKAFETVSLSLYGTS